VGPHDPNLRRQPQHAGLDKVNRIDAAVHVKSRVGGQNSVRKRNHSDQLATLTIEAAATVDMPLRLDNANALTTYPQQKQKKQEAA
jgi:hypothetical protein